MCICVCTVYCGKVGLLDLYMAGVQKQPCLPGNRVEIIPFVSKHDGAWPLTHVVNGLSKTCRFWR